jgi:hypothetical protein
MYHLLTDFTETIKGIKGYYVGIGGFPRIISHFIFKKDTAWDHVNLYSFSFCVLFIISLILLVPVSVFIKKKCLSLIFVLYLFLYNVFIYFLSPGYPTHGFTFSLFIMISVIFFVKEAPDKTSRLRFPFYILLLTAAFMQAYNNFVVYIPFQADLERETTRAVHSFVASRRQIKAEIDSIKGPSDRKIISNIRRYMRDGDPTGQEVHQLMLSSDLIDTGDLIIEAKMNFKNKKSLEFWNNYSRNFKGQNESRIKIIYDNSDYFISEVE